MALSHAYLCMYLCTQYVFIACIHLVTIFYIPSFPASFFCSLLFRWDLGAKGNDLKHFSFIYAHSLIYSFLVIFALLLMNPHHYYLLHLINNIHSLYSNSYPGSAFPSLCLFVFFYIFPPLILSVFPALFLAPLWSTDVSSSWLSPALIFLIRYSR